MRVVATLLLALLSAQATTAAVLASGKCEHKTLLAAAKAAHGFAKCHAAAAASGVAVEGSCLNSAAAKLAADFAKAQERDGCLFDNEAAAVATTLQQMVADLTTQIGGPLPASQCAAQLWKASGKRAKSLLKQEANHGKKPERARLGEGMIRAADVFTRAFAAAAGKPDCPPAIDEADLAAAVDEGVDAAVDAVRGTLAALAEQRGILVGAAVRGSVLAADPPRYAGTLRRQFNYVTPEYELMWGNLEPVRGAPDFGPADTVIDFAEQNGMTIKAMPLVWHLILPSWVPGLDAAELQQELDARITSLVTRYRGRVSAWVVVNEAVNNAGTGLLSTIFLQKLGPEYIANAFRTARAADPDALLFYNDYVMENVGAKSDYVLAMVEDLLAQGVPIDGVGFQTHLSAGGIFGGLPITFRQNLERFAELGILVDISEMDVQVANLPGSPADRLERQREIYRSVVDDCLDVPACHAVTFWGFTDAYTWIRDYLGIQDKPLLYDDDILPKPAFFGVRDALAEE